MAKIVSDSDKEYCKYELMQVADLLQLAFVKCSCTSEVETLTRVSFDKVVRVLNKFKESER